MHETRCMIRTPADEKAVAAGCRFDGERAAFACDWIEQYCRLYEGEKSGQPLALLPFWREFLSRLFGWVRYSSEWGGWIRRFNRAAIWAAKKNGKSPVAAAYNLYLLAGDGEPGQKVYMMAGNSKQARISQLHAVMMVQKSPELAADCKVNNTTMDIVHLPTTSRIEVVTGDDKRSADKKHGYNGSVTMDEMHVIDRQMVDAVGRAGISRREPLQTSFSTSGMDMDSAGYERFLYGRQVNSGERDDPHFLHVEYCAPDKISDADIDERLDEFARMANPAWGTIVKPSELRADWQASKGNPRNVAKFRMERLNLWVGSTNQWLDGRGWDRGKEAYSLADLAGRECFAAVDLSRTRDMTACVFCFPDEEGEGVQLWPMFWIPEQTARERDHLFPYRSWADSNHVTLTDGGVVDYSKVKADIRAAVKEHGLRVQRLYFDSHYAEEITQQLADGESMGGESVDGIGGERVAFPQTLMSFTGPSKEFERRVSAGLVRHPGNPVLTWMAGHCEIWTDTNQNIRPVKPKPASGKSVDGIVAAVMSFADLLVKTEEEYASPNIWTV